jgi:hypothetical protein
MARLIAAMRLPTPPMPAGAVESKHGVCDEFCKITHPLHSPKPEPTTVYRLRGKDAYWCAECCAAFDKAQAAYNRLNAPVPVLVYEDIAVAACDEPEAKEHIVKVSTEKPAKLTKAQQAALELLAKPNVVARSRNHGTPHIVDDGMWTYLTIASVTMKKLHQNRWVSISKHDVFSITYAITDAGRDVLKANRPYLSLRDDALWIAHKERCNEAVSAHRDIKYLSLPAATVAKLNRDLAKALADIKAMEAEMAARGDEVYPFALDGEA